MVQATIAAKTKEAEDSTDSRRHYELMLIISPTLSDKDRDGVIAEWQKVVEKEGGEITHTEIIGTRELSYPIRHNARGYYVYLQFLFDPGSQKAIKKKLMVDMRLLRYLLIEIAMQYKVEIFDKDIVYGGLKADNSAVAQELVKERKQAKKTGKAVMEAKVEPAIASEPEVAAAAAKAVKIEAVVPPIKPAEEPEATSAPASVPVADGAAKDEHEGAATEAKRMADLDEKLKELLGS